MQLEVVFDELLWIRLTGKFSQKRNDFFQLAVRPIVGERKDRNAEIKVRYKVLGRVVK